MYLTTSLFSNFEKSAHSAVIRLNMVTTVFQEGMMMRNG